VFSIGGGPTAVIGANARFIRSTTTAGQTVRATGVLAARAILGQIDRTWTTTNSFGGSTQIAASADPFGHGNNFVLGLSVDRGLVQFSTASERRVSDRRFLEIRRRPQYRRQPISARFSTSVLFLI